MRSFLSSLMKKLTRLLVRAVTFYLPKDRKIEVERWIRGRDQYKKLRRADCVIVSFGKSGRTWLRVMLSRLYQVKHGLSERHLIGFDNLHYKNPAIPKMFFTHDNYLKDYTGNDDNKADYYGRKIVLLVRNPADVAVSQYFQWRYRMRPRKKSINAYPSHGEEVPIFDFVARKEAGLSKVIDFMNGWAKEFERLEDVLVVRYEDMRAQPEATLARVAEFIGTPGTPEEIRDAVEFASVDNMRKMEQRRVFWLSGGRMLAKDRSDPNTYKVRRAKVGGYRDYFSDDEVNEIEATIRSRLSPVFGYTEPDDPRRAESA
ncbi:MAG: sulfotransferase domain-containing protein [Kiloniellales bacterium]|nr:sulfotransferase domain-containing protein [Kiloniellales bacterium]